MASRFPWRVVFGFTAVVVVIVGANAVISRVDSARRVERIKAKLERLHQLGWATSGEGMPKGPPAETNAYLAIAPHMARGSNLEKKSPQLGEINVSALLRPEDAKYLKIALERESAVLKIVDEAFRTKPNYWPPRKYDWGMFDLFPDFVLGKSLGKLMMARVAVDVREGRFADAKEKMGWIHRVEQSCFEQTEVTSWLVGLAIMKIEQRELMILLQDGQPVEGLLEASASGWEAFTYDYSRLVQGDFLSSIVMPRLADDPEAQREKWEIKAREFLHIESAKSLGMDERTRLGDYIPQFPKMQRMTEQILDKWIELGDKPKTTADWLTRLYQTRKQNDALYASAPYSLTGGQWESMTEEDLVRTARVCEQPRLLPNIQRAFLRAWAIRKKTGRWPVSEAEFGMDIAWAWKGTKFEYRAEPGMFTIVSPMSPTDPDSAYRFSYPPRTSTKISAPQLEQRKLELERIGVLKPSNSKPAVLGGPPGP